MSAVTVPAAAPKSISNLFSENCAPRDKEKHRNASTSNAGQTKNVTLHRFLIDDSIDTEIYDSRAAEIFKKTQTQTP